MADPPRLTKLGAKWVEVKSGGLKASVVAWWGRIETWPATPVEASLTSSLKGLP